MKSVDFIYQPENRLEDALKALSGRVKFHPRPIGSEQVPEKKVKKSKWNSIELVIKRFYIYVLPRTRLNRHTERVLDTHSSSV